MKQTLSKKVLIFLACISLFSTSLFAQSVTIQVVSVNPFQLKYDDLYDIEINNDGASYSNVNISGRLYFSASKVSISFTKTMPLPKGKTTLSRQNFTPQLTFSDNNLKTLYNANIFPNEDFEYCVELAEKATAESNRNILASDCIYDKADNGILLNLIDPDDNAKISDLNPALSWNMSSVLPNIQYRLRLAELREKQTANQAVLRNPLLVDMSSIGATTQQYPFSAPALQYWTKYGWTVDAYLGNILMASAESWQFAIVDDSIVASIPKDIGYLDIRKDLLLKNLYAVGKLKISYKLDQLKQDNLKCILTDNEKSNIDLKQQAIVNVKYGDNFFEFDFKDKIKLKHLHQYRITVTNSEGQSYPVDFLYFNPDFL